MKNPQSTESIGRQIESRVSEFLDGYILVGFIAGEPPSRPIIIANGNDDPKTVLALNSLILSAVQAVSISKEGQ